MKPEIKEPVIVFDLGNTLIRFDHNIAAKKIKHLIKVPYEDLYQMFFDSPFTRAFEKGEIEGARFHERIREALGLDIGYEEFVPIWNEIFWADEVTCGIARRLKADGYRLFLLSNVNKLHFEYINSRFDIIKIFDELILSYKVGSMKPEKAIFDEVVRRAGGDRAGLLYIDDREDLIKEARALGIRSIRFEGGEKLEKELKGLGLVK